MNKLTEINFFEGDGYKGFGPLGLENGNATDAPSLFTKFISSTIGLMTIIAIIWFIITFFIGAIGIISSGGDKNSLETAKKKISTGVIGIVVTFLALLIIRLIARLIGLGDILDFQLMFQNLLIT